MTNQNLEQIEDLLDEKFRELELYDLGTEGRQSVLNEIERLHKLKVEELKLEVDKLTKQQQAQEEATLKKLQLKEQKLDRYFKAGIAAFEVGLPIIFYGKWLKAGFKFEEEGVYTSSTFKNLINKFKPTK